MLLHLLLGPSAIPVEEVGQLEAANHIEDAEEEDENDDEEEEDEDDDDEEDDEEAGGAGDLKEDPRLMILGFSLLTAGVSVHLGSLCTNSYNRRQIFAGFNFGKL